MMKFCRIFWIIFYLPFSLCTNITSLAFGSYTNIKPAAFGDFNSDELTDLFIIRNGDKTAEILLGSGKEPFFSKDLQLNCTFSEYLITSIVPGDFNGDALMDMLVTAKKINEEKYTYVFINRGGLNYLNCSSDPIFKMQDEPLAISFDKNMTIDLFGVNENGNYSFWIFKKNRIEDPNEEYLNMTGVPSNFKMRVPHSHAFIDLNNDNFPDLCLTGETSYGIWLWSNTEKQFVFNNTIEYPENLHDTEVGQTLFIDLETADNMYPIIPVCLKSSKMECVKSAIYVFAHGLWYNLNMSFADQNNETWVFARKKDYSYIDTVTLRSGDFNNDGYVDLLATLTPINKRQKVVTFLLENVPCVNNICNLKRTFEIRWDALSTVSENTVMGTFYDFMQDGIMDIIFVHAFNNNYQVSAFKNSLDYDANFIKVMVIMGLKNKENELSSILLGSKRTFGTNLPGPKIRYKTTTQDGNTQTGIAAQLPQSAHFALYLPYTIFGLGRTPNFVEDLTIGMFNESKTWNQIIPNSQLIVIPYPPDNPFRWRAQLFVTPSKIIWQTVIALTGTCVVIAFIIILLHWKERREDRIERLQEAHRFHFDAM